ncbi:hypothetical protein B0H10DRAFT_1960572 [Mycena sp. CBHHK59/15]|nr:hypothetical protein B0H10DRAFT_1960572 [Mycena sp. CBHHK59/15]
MSEYPSRFARTLPPLYKHPPHPDLSSSPPIGQLRPITPNSAGTMAQPDRRHSFDPHNTHALSSPDFPPILSLLACFPPNPPSHNHSPAYLFPDDPLPEFSLPDNGLVTPVSHPAGTVVQDIFPANPMPRAPTTRTRQKAPARVPSPDEDLEAIGLEILLHVLPAAKGKAAKPDPIKFGPVQANVDMEHSDLLEKVAEVVNTDIPFLATLSMEWCFIKPANSLFLPLHNDAGWKSLKNQMCNPPKSSTQYIIIQMDAPVKKPQAPDASWSRSDPGHTSALDTVYDIDDGFDGEDGPKKPATFDQGLEEIIDKLTVSWIGTRNHLCFSSDEFAIPLASNFFKESAAIKKKSARAEAPIPNAVAGLSMAALPMSSNPTAQSLQPQFPFYQAPYPYTPFPPMGYPPPPFPSYPGLYGHPFPMETPSRSDRLRHEQSWDESSPPHQKRRRSERTVDPPSSPAFSSGSLDEFLDENPGFMQGQSRSSRNWTSKLGMIFR